MSNPYYQNLIKNIPNTIECHIDTLLVYMASLLFPDEFKLNPQKAYDRILISDVNAGSNVSLGDVIQFMKTMNSNFPFAVYNVGESIPPDDYGNIAPHTNFQLLYVPEIEKYVRAYPMECETQWIIFYTEVLDHRRAYTILGSENSSLTRLYTPAKFWDTEVTLPMTLGFEFSKGNFVGEFEQYLAQGRIYDVVLSIKLRYYEYLIDDVPNLNEKTTKDLSGVFGTGVYPNVSKIDNVLLRLFSQFGSNIKESSLIEEVIVPEPLIIMNVSPSNDSNKVPVTSEIIINFNNPIKPDSVKDGIEISGDLEYNIYYSSDYKIVNFKPKNILGFKPKTKYKVTINNKLIDLNDSTLDRLYTFEFITN